MPQFDLLLRHATLPDGNKADIGITQGRITHLTPDSPPDDLPALQTIDLAGSLVCPGLIDGHIHLDKTFLGSGWHPHVPGRSIRARIAAEKQALAELAVPTVDRAAALVELAISRGSTVLRTHVDIDPEVGLANLDRILEVRDRYQDAISIQIVAFPQSGVISCPGTLELLQAAIAQGADLIGGLDPAGIDGDVTGQLDGIFHLAQQQGVGLDIHLHDPDEIGIAQLEAIAQRTSALGMAGRVAVSHAYCLGMVSEAVLNQTGEQLAQAGVAIMTNAPGDHAFPPVATLRSLGVNLFAGSDNIRDAWSPFGDADMLERAMLIAYRSGFYTDLELQMSFDMATTAAAQALGLESYGLHIGAAADLVVVAAESVSEAVVARPVRQWVIKGGRVVAQAGQFVGN